MANIHTLRAALAEADRIVLERFRALRAAADTYGVASFEYQTAREVLTQSQEARTNIRRQYDAENDAEMSRYSDAAWQRFAAGLNLA